MSTIADSIDPSVRARLDALGANSNPNPPEALMNTPGPQTTGIDVELDAVALDWIDQLARQASPPLSRDEVITELLSDACDRGWRPRPGQAAALLAQEEANRS